MKKLISITLISFAIIAMSFVKKVTPYHEEEKCYDSYSEMNTERNAREAQLQNNLIEESSWHYQFGSTPSQGVQYCYVLKWYE
jgi:hypothetical protein